MRTRRMVLCRSLLRAGLLFSWQMVFLAAPLAGQSLERTGPLPPIDMIPAQPTPSMAGEPPFLLARDPLEYRGPEELLPPAGPNLEPYKKTFFQKLSLNVTELLPGGSEGLGILESELQATFALPAPTTDMPLLLIPTLRMDLVDDSQQVPLPEQLYMGILEFMWLPRIGTRTQAMLAIAPGWYSDFEAGDSGAFRLTGRAILIYDHKPGRTKLALGAVYLDRTHSQWIPAGGVIFTPNPELNFELIFPEAKIARRTSWGLGFEHWIYLTGGFGGSDWSVIRPDGSRDTLGLLDWRITAGWERKMNGGAGFHVEAGYVFAREIRFASSSEKANPDSTLLLRAGFAF